MMKNAEKKSEKNIDERNLLLVQTAHKRDGIISISYEEKIVDNLPANTANRLNTINKMVPNRYIDLII